MSKKKAPNYQDFTFPADWPDAERIAWINDRLADHGVYSVEIRLQGQELRLRVWYGDHTAK